MRSPGGNPTTAATTTAIRGPRASKVAAAAAGPPPQLIPARRKGAAAATAAVREWLVVKADGTSQHEEVGKQPIMRRTGLQPRDLRVLDPLLSYPSTILGRERAIVVNLEHVKAIITSSEVLISNAMDPLIESLVQDLRARLTLSERSPEQGSPKLMMDLPRSGSTKVLPFEFRALEVCLESACKSLEWETSALEKEAYPALDELTTKVSTLNLENVRQLKSRLVAITGRVQKVRDDVEHLLDDDIHMAAMYLTEKLLHREAGGLSSRFDLDKDPIKLCEERDEDEHDDDDKDWTEGDNESLSGFKPNIHELEMLLEAYFVQTDGILNKLSTLREYVDDTEDYINIMLDDKQNQLLQMGIVLTTATLVATTGIIVTGFLSINVHIPLYNSPYIKFWETMIGLTVGGIILYIIVHIWYKKSGLLQ
uniref:Magnesium transporter n=1 Tax=Ananas comosus var. bracteatus TaxID=296719 RepID=A0A6V7NWD3_ANACO|nr:unnamed protein product [Ananas comosus var. bracteatus]